jgi:hypothetical protein
MHPLAHHAGEDTLAPLLLLGSAWLPLVVAVGRTRLAAAHARLTRKQSARRDRDAGQDARAPSWR